MTQTLLPELASQVLRHIADGRAFNEVVLALDSHLNFQFALHNKEPAR